MSLNKFQPALSLLLCLVIGMWWLSSFKYSMKWDMMDITLPWSHFISECIRSGELPLWNPYLKNGFPMMGLPDTWYPITWMISFVFGIDVWSIQLMYLLHLFIGAYGIYMYCNYRKIDAHFCLAISVCYMFSGFMIGNAQHLGWIIGGAWLPWVFLYYDRLIELGNRVDLLKLALACSLLFYGSYPPITIIIFYILLIKSIVTIIRTNKAKQLILNLSLAFIIFFTISCVGIVGLIDLTPHLNRGGQLPLSDTGWGVLTGFLPTQAISSFIVPYAGTAAKSYWGSDVSLINCYFGLLPLLCLMVGLFERDRRSWVCFSVGLAFLLIAMSDLTPFRAWLYYVPMFDKFRFPSLFRLFAIFFLLLGSGFAYTGLKQKNKLRLKLSPIFSFILIMMCGWLIYLWFSDEFFSLSTLLDDGLNTFNSKSSFYNKVSLNLLIHTLLIGGLLCYLFFRKHSWKYLPLFIIVEVLIISQFNISETVIHFGDPKIGNQEINSYKSTSMNVDLKESMNTFNDGHWKAHLSWFRFNQACITKTPSADGNSPFSLLKFKQAKENGDIELNGYPLMFFADVKNEKVVDESVVKNSNNFIEVLISNNNEFELATNYPNKINLIFLQNHYPGWKVTVNNKESKVRLVNTTFMSIPLEGGAQKVKLEFRPTKMIFSFYMSVTSLLLTLFGTLYHQYQNKVSKNLSLLQSQ